MNVGAVFNREIKCRGWKPHLLKFIQLNFFYRLLRARFQVPESTTFRLQP